MLMTLRDFADQVALPPSLTGASLRENRLWADAYEVIGNETRTDPTVAAVLSQIVLLTHEFSRALGNRGLDVRNPTSQEIMLLQRSVWGEYVLVVADDRLADMESSQVLFLSSDSLREGLRRWKQSSPGGRQVLDKEASQLGRVYYHVSADDLASLQTFNVYFIRRPKRIPTSAPVPGWKVQSAGINGWVTAGCRVQHANGGTGVTSVRHFFPTSTAVGTTVKVGASQGIVEDEDPISDSVFIRLESGVPLAASRGAKGWLKGIAPRVGEVTVFDGATSGVTTPTAVMASDPGVASYSPYRQARVYTPPVTNPGDSGAALVENSTDLVVGFAHERTEAGAFIEWSSWIWADSVFTALNVEPL